MTSFYKNSQVARLFKISHTTVTNWIEASENGQNDLQLASIGNKKVIIDSPHNKEVIRKLIERGRKHSWTSKKITTVAKPEIYSIFSQNQLGELAASIISKREVPYKFSYLNGGADLWDKHYQVSSDNKERIVYKENKLISENCENLLYKFTRYTKINIFDIGCGNGLPACNFIKFFKDHNIQVTYTALDISERMIHLDKESLLKMWPDLDHSYKVIDIDSVNLAEILLTKRSTSQEINLLLFLGGTIGNLQDTSRVLSNLRDSMTMFDYLVIGAGLETNEVALTATEPHNQFHYRRTLWILDYLGLERSYPDSTMDKYDLEKKEYIRKILIQKDVSTSIKIGLDTVPLEFKEGDEILVSRFRRFKEEEIIHEVLAHSFAIDQFVGSSDNSYMLLIVRPKLPIS